MSQLEKHHICCRLKVPQDQTNSQLYCPAVVLLSAPCPTRGRSSYLVRVTALARGAHLPSRGVWDWTQKRRDLNSYTVLKASREAKTGNYSLSLHNVLKLTDRKEKGQESALLPPEPMSHPFHSASLTPFLAIRK